MKKSALTVLGLYGWALGMSSTDLYAIEGSSRKKDPEHFRKPIDRPHSGQKEYFFREDGTFENERQTEINYVFTCFAINDKNALKKYKHWKVTL